MEPRLKANISRVGISSAFSNSDIIQLPVHFCTRIVIRRWTDTVSRSTDV